MKRRFTRTASQMRGFGIIELMVAMTLGLMLVGVIGSVYLASARATRTSALEAQMNEEGTLALEFLQSHLRLAGFSSTAADGKRTFKGLPLRGCDGGFTPQTSNQAFQGLACNNALDVPDALAIQYEATLSNSIQIDSNPQFLPGNCAGLAIAPSDQGGGVMVTMADNRFYIANDAVNQNRPSLWCRGSNGAGFSAAAALIPNIEDLQVRYGITRSGTVGDVMPHQVTAHVDASHNALSGAAADWTRVAAVHLCVLVRSADPVPAGDVDKADIGRHVACDGSMQTAADQRLRRSYRTTVHLRNVRPVLPAPYAEKDNMVANPYQALIADE